MRLSLKRRERGEREERERRERGERGEREGRVRGERDRGRETEKGIRTARATAATVVAMATREKEKLKGGD